MLFKSSAYNRHSIEFNLTEFNSVNQIQLNQIKFVFNDKRLKQPVQTGNELRDCTVAQYNRKKDAFELLLMQSLTVLRLIIYPKRKEWLQKRRLKLPARSTKAQKHKSTVHSVLCNRQHISRTFPFLSSSCRALMTQS